MGLMELIKPFPWKEYSKKLNDKIMHLPSAGIFTEEEAKAHNLRLVVGKEGSVDDGHKVAFYWLVDPEDGMIVDAKFQAYGDPALLGAAETACMLVIHKYYDQARRMGSSLIDKQLRDFADTPSFPKECLFCLNLVIDAIDNAAEQCGDIPLPSTYVSPIPQDIEVVEGGYPGWHLQSTEQKLSLIEEIIKEEVRPYIQLDGGDVEILNLLNDYEVIISYQGNCTSCISSTGATLSYIQQILRAKLSKDIVVVPDLEGLSKEGY